MDNNIIKDLLYFGLLAAIILIVFSTSLSTPRYIKSNPTLPEYWECSEWKIACYSNLGGAYEISHQWFSNISSCNELPECQRYGPCTEAKWCVKEVLSRDIKLPKLTYPPCWADKNCKNIEYE